MSPTDLCRCCGQPLPPQERGGVFLPPRKVMIFDFIRKHPGVTVEGIRAHCFPDDARLQTIRVHICQINDMLAGTDLRIENINGYRLISSAGPGARANRPRKPPAPSSSGEPGSTSAHQPSRSQSKPDRSLASFGQIGATWLWFVPTFPATTWGNTRLCRTHHAAGLTRGRRKPGAGP